MDGERRTMRDFVRGGVLWLPALLAGLVAVLVGVGLAGDDPDDDFHVAAAQIIPVLLLALVVETNMRKVWGTGRGRRFGGMVVGFLLVGELSAILEAGDIFAIDRVNLALTGAGLVGGFVAVALVAVVPTKKLDLPEEVTERRSPWA